MGLTDSLAILITANGAQAQREFSRTGEAARRGLGQAETASQRWGRTLTSAGVAMATFGGVALVGLYKAAQAAQEEDLAIARLNNSIANSTELAGTSSDAFLEQAAALQDVTTFADDASIGVQALLAQFDLTEDQILQLTPLVLDLSSKMGVSLEAAAKAAGRATQGTTGGLSRMIGAFDAGDTEAEAFTNTLGALQSTVGGFAETEAETFNGQLEIMKNNLGDLVEGVGRGAVSAFNDMLGPIQGASDGLGELDPELQSSAGRMLAFGSGGLVAAGAASFLAGQALQAAERLTALRTALAGANLASVAAKGGLIALAGAVGYALGELTEGPDMVEEFADALADLHPNNVGGLREIAHQMTLAAAAGELSNEQIVDIVEATGRIDATQARELGDALLAAGVEAGVVSEAMQAVLASGNFAEASGSAERALADLYGNLAETSTAAGRLGRAWDRLTGNLSEFDAVTSASQAMFDLRDGLAEAQADGRITAEEMLGLRQNLSGLVSAYQSVATEATRNADGTENQTAAARRLRRDLGALAGFIPAQLRPQFRQLTQDILRVPRRHETDLRLTTTADVSSAMSSLDQLEGRIREVAISYNQADFNRGQAATGGSASAPRSAGGESAPAGRRRERAQPVLVVGGVG